MREEYELIIAHLEAGCPVESILQNVPTLWLDTSRGMNILMDRRPSGESVFVANLDAIPKPITWRTSV